MESPPESPQEYETPTTSVQNRVQSVDYEEFSLQKKRTTQPHVYQVLEKQEQQIPVYANKSTENQDSGMYESVAVNNARLENARSSDAKTSSSPASPPREYRYGGKAGGDSSPVQGSYNTATILKVLVVVVVLAVAIVVSVTALVLAMREQTCECTDDLDRINQLENMVAEFQDMIADNQDRINFLSETTSAVNSTLSRRIGGVAERLVSLNNRVLINGVSMNCTTEIETSCALVAETASPQCTTPPVNYQTDRRVIDFSCVSLNEQNPPDIAGTLITTAILNEDMLVCQCTIIGLSGDEDRVNSECGLKVTRCAQISVSFQL